MPCGLIEGVFPDIRRSVVVAGRGVMNEDVAISTGMVVSTGDVETKIVGASGVVANGVISSLDMGAVISVVVVS